MHVRRTELSDEPAIGATLASTVPVCILPSISFQLQYLRQFQFSPFSTVKTSVNKALF
jgi:hypothetical protein